jgi:trigger factor
MADDNHNHNHDHDHDHDHNHDHDHEHGEKLAQEVKIEDVGPARKKIRIEIPAERIAEKIQGNYEELQAEAAVPGFRRGRAPIRLLEKRFGKDVKSEVKTQLLGESYSQVIEENDFRVLGEPDIKDAESIELPEEGALSFEVEIEVVPEFELPDLAGLKIQKKLFEVTDEQVEAEIDRYCEMQGKPAAIDGDIEPGDYITADIEVRTEDGEVASSQPSQMVFVPGESRKFKGVVAGILIEDLGHKIEGHKIGDTVSLEATGPEQHENEALREKKLTIDLKITKAERMEPMSLADLLEQSGFESEDMLRDQIRQNLEQRGEAEQQQDMHRQVTDALIEKVEFDLPEKLSEKQAERTLSRRRMELLYRGSSEQDIEENLAELRAASQEESQRELKQFFILDKVAQKFEVDVSQAEVNGRVAQMAISRGQRPERMREEMARTGQLDQLYIQLREQKAIEKIIEGAQIEEVKGEPAAEDKPEKTTKKTTKKKTTKKPAAKKDEDKAE